MNNPVVNTLEQFENLNSSGKIFVIDFISNISLNQIKEHKNKSKDFEYSFNLDKYGLHYLDVKHLLNNHIYNNGKDQIELTLLVCKVDKSFKEKFGNKNRTLVTSVVPHQALFLFEELKKKYSTIDL